MDLLLIERLLGLMGRAPIQELEFVKDGWRIRLAKGVSSLADRPAALAPLPPLEAAEPRASGVAMPAADKPQLVVAGLVGTFYRSAAAGHPPFVSVGDVVEDGQTLGILEAMKTLIKVEADCAGTVAEILAQDGAAVQAGDPLFAISPVARP